MPPGRMPGKAGPDASIHEPGHLPSFVALVAGGVTGDIRTFRSAAYSPRPRVSLVVDQLRSDPTVTTVFVCTTCRDERHGFDDRPCAGSRLHAALGEVTANDDAIALVPVECLSVCKRSCAVAFAAPGKWTYVFGDLPAEAAAATVAEGARLYTRSLDGIIPWKFRPEALKKGAVARIPILPSVPILPLATTSRA